nr:ribonucleotide reductase subunit 1 [Equid alphaherpesvirus 1]WMD90973.1 ribonucleotide reductase subunit 1 [Equid alphaherpesvirus 1]WMD91093.1 ribonucleotide reductase subunit 1 [Equid alphaherpesvirus 1]WMD91167.1 ribonucleotide reductase subunit 1 [Equid alphaherpesvirus 1]WMD91311.1 ribonucleotide reductase subunit 1 [Equid alphaherpesvirus 1]
MALNFLQSDCPLAIIQDVISRVDAISDYGYANELSTTLPPRPSRSQVLEYITRVVDTLKPRCRVDERLYVVCGELVHLRIRTRNVEDLKYWLNSTEIALNEIVEKDILDHLDFIQRTLHAFESSEYRELCALGLQSALKYEEMYLAKMRGGRIESMGQFFLRLATTATHYTMEEPAMARVLVSGEVGWTYIFKAYFTALAGQVLIPATPIMLFGGRDCGSLASCYLLNPRVTDMNSAMLALMEEAGPILCNRGGIGLSLQRFNTPPKEGCSRGVMALLKLIDSMTIAINSDGERPTGVCVYFEPWHADIRAILNMRGMLARDETVRCDNIFACMWTPDLFFDRYQRYLDGESGVMWTLFDDTASHLCHMYGKEFEEEYERLEQCGFGVDSIPIQDMAFIIVRSAVMTGSPFLMFKDACNKHYHFDLRRKGAIMGSNLCTEIIQHADETQNGVCNLASINLPKCLAIPPPHTAGVPYFDFAALGRAAATATIFVNSMMRAGTYPTVKSQRGVDENRSLGLGIQGLHTAFLMLDLDMASPEARQLNKQIAERLLLNSMKASATLCRLGMKPFKGFEDSKYSLGELPFDSYPGVTLANRNAWRRLRTEIKQHGLYNSQFVAYMPTVSSSQVTESSEGFSPVYTNLFSKVTATGEVLRPNLLLMRTIRSIFPRECARLQALSTLEMAQWSVVGAFGDLPVGHPLSKFKTAFEYDQKTLIDMCADRAPFVDQSQSMSLFITEPADGKLPASKIMSLLVHAYKRGLKTGMYYCKIKKATNNGVFVGGDLVCTSCSL